MNDVKFEVLLTISIRTKDGESKVGVAYKKTVPSNHVVPIRSSVRWGSLVGKVTEVVCNLGKPLPEITMFAKISKEMDSKNFKEYAKHLALHGWEPIQ